MKLAEVEQREREQREINHELALQKIAAEKLAEQETREKFRQEIIAWMVEQGDLDAQELEMVLSVPDVIGRLRLIAPEHQPIIFDVIKSTRQKDEGWRVRDGRFCVEPLGDSSLLIRCRSLGEALIEAGEIFQQDREANHAPDANP